MKYLQGYPDNLREQVQQLMADGQLGAVLLKKYPEAQAELDKAAQLDAPNAAQAQYWNEAAGPTWASLQAKLDRQLAPLGQHAIAVLAPRPGERILDIGCGQGLLASWLLSAKALHDARQWPAHWPAAPATCRGWSSKKKSGSKARRKLPLGRPPRNIASSTSICQSIRVRMARSCAGALRAVTSAVRMRMAGVPSCCKRCKAASKGLKGPASKGCVALSRSWA